MKCYPSASIALRLALLIGLFYTLTPQSVRAGTKNAQPLTECERALNRVVTDYSAGQPLDALATVTDALGNQSSAATCLATLYTWRALLNNQLYDLDAAEADYREALQRWQVLLAAASDIQPGTRFGDPTTDVRLATAATANNLGLLLARMGRYQEALRLLNESLTMLETQPAQQPLMATPTFTPTAHVLDATPPPRTRQRGRGRRVLPARATVTLTSQPRTQRGNAPTPVGTPALRTMNEVLPAAILDDPAILHQRLAVFNNIGLVYINLGDYAKANAQFDTVLSLTTDQQERAEALHHKAVVARGQGHYTLAHSLLDQAETAARLSSANRVGGLIQSTRGATFVAQQQYGDAIAAYRAALEFATTMPEAVPVETVFQFRAGLVASRRVVDDSMGRYETVPIVSGSSELAAQALIHHNIGNAYRLQGELDKAFQSFDISLNLAERAGSIIGLLSTLHAMALSYEANGDIPQAIATYEDALELLESVSARLTISDLQSSFHAKQAPIYSSLIRLFAERGEDAAAFAVAERARARAFLNQLGGGAVNLSQTIPATLAQQEEALRKKIVGLQQTLNAARAQSPPEQIVTSQLAAQLEEARGAYEDILLQIQLANPEFAALLAVETLSLDEVRSQIVDEQTTLIVYYVLADETLAWVIDKEGAVLEHLNIGHATLTAQTEFLRDLIIGNRDFDAGATANLYDHLFAPLKPHIGHGNLVVVPHGVLHYLPFAALWNRADARYLIQEYPLTYAPSASALKFIQAKRNANEERLLALGNPDGSLPHAAREAQSVGALYGTAPFTGTQATEGRVHSLAGQIDLLHLAAHGVYNPFNPLFTRIELTADGQHDGNLEVHEVYGLELTEANLVVLSACDTAQGDLNQGDELVGLTRAFLYAGAPSLITTLWPVDDAASGALMKGFYAGLQDGLTTAEALRAVQLDVLAQEGWESPYFWAAFGLTGDYRWDDR